VKMPREVELRNAIRFRESDGGGRADAEIILKPADMGIDKPTIERFLRVVPAEDLEGLKEIVITYPEHAFEPSSYNPYQSKVKILIDSVFGIHSSEDIAWTLFHEIGHHTQYKSPYWRKIWRKIGRYLMDRCHVPYPKTEISKFEGFASSYADEKLEKLRQTDPKILRLDWMDESLKEIYDEVEKENAERRKG